MQPACCVGRSNPLCCRCSGRRQLKMQCDAQAGLQMVRPLLLADRIVAMQGSVVGAQGHTDHVVTNLPQTCLLGLAQLTLAAGAQVQLTQSLKRPWGPGATKCEAAN